MNMYIVSKALWKVYCNRLLFTMAIVKFTHILLHAYKKRPNILILFRQAPCMFIFTSQWCNTYLFLLYLTLPYLALPQGLGFRELPRARNPHVWVGR